MLQPRLFLLLLVAAVGIVLVFEMGFDNKWPGGGFAQSNRPLAGQQAVPTTALQANCSFLGVLRRHPARSFGHGNSNKPETPTDVTSNNVASEECVHIENLTSVPIRPAPKPTQKLSPPPSPVSKSRKWSEKGIISLVDSSNSIIDRQMRLKNDPVFSYLSRSRLNRILQPIMGMPVVKNESVVRVLVVTYFRAGSTFLGDILQQNWKTFYHFEPLHILSLALRIDEIRSHEALEFLSHLFRCDFSRSSLYIKWASKAKNQFLFRHNHFLWATCRGKLQNCFFPEYISEVCKRAPVQVMKVTRVHMHHVEQFFKDNPDLNVKVVHLVRDPRGIVSSRKVLEWCKQASCMDPKELCLEMQRDLEIFRKMQQEYRERLIQVRYEDLALNSSAEAKTLYEALGMPFTSVVQRFIKSHTHARPNERNDPYSTKRNSSVTAFEWRHKLSFQDIEAIQKECSVIMDALGYKKFNSQKDQTDVSIPMMKSFKRSVLS